MNVDRLVRRVLYWPRGSAAQQCRLEGMDVALEKLHEGEVIVLRTQLDEAERIVLSVKSEPASGGSWTRVILAPAQ